MSKAEQTPPTRPADAFRPGEVKDRIIMASHEDYAQGFDDGKAQAFKEAAMAAVAEPLPCCGCRATSVERRIRALADQPPPEPMPGDLIAKVGCPCCGADLEVVHGEDEGMIGAYGTPRQGPQ